MNEEVNLIAEKNMPLPRTTLWRLRTSGRLPFYRIGRRIYYSPEHLESLLKACEIRRGNANERQ